MGRHRPERRSHPAPGRWTHLLARLPWITLVLLVVLVVGTAELVQPRTYAASATLTAPTERAADQLSVQLTDPALPSEVERAVELDPELSGSVRLAVRHEAEDREVHLQATAPDPRLAALAADTGAALSVQERADGTELTQGARVPTEPVDDRGLLWLILAAALLAVAVRIEAAHRARPGDHPAPQPSGAS
ncbi:hypothetical protein AVL62_14260 [Serinicoccus chungangensis]|uniref:Polysaccharide chain length determinant N-terminal domain-containing protein n=1 Tax=Serinicoccus chungangensis TaxID=767452 RepID=A0A0W8I3M4_9MICO|nr:hypothetical protein [Serinicoccus chungangensis]KUG52485.1 hypothetical protein AVL62_14260 [Serinicoccus chungangensis]